MKLYLDEHLPPILADILVKRGIDCQTTHAAGNIGKSDEDQLAYASSHGRVMVTFDRKDFLYLAKQWATSGRTHTGIVLSRQCAVSELLRLVLHLIAQHKKDDLTNQVLWLQNYRQPPLP